MKITRRQLKNIILREMNIISESWTKGGGANNENQRAVGTIQSAIVNALGLDDREYKNEKKIQTKLGVKNGSTIDAKWGPSTEKAWKEASDNKPVPDNPIKALEMLKDKMIKTVGEDRYNEKMEALKKDFK